MLCVFCVCSVCFCASMAVEVEQCFVIAETAVRRVRNSR
jgi:hypothetical protein